MSLEKNLSVRIAESQDLPFICDSWLRSYQVSRVVKDVPQDIYFSYQPKVIANIMHREASSAFVVMANDDSDVLIGHMVIEPDTLHYIYVKRAFNRLGVSSFLLDASPFRIAGAFATHITNSGKSLMNRYQLVYNPYLLGGITHG